MVSFQGLRDSGASLCLIFQARPRLREVHWQVGDRPVPEPEVSTSGESALWVAPAEIPAGADVAKLGLVEVAGRLYVEAPKCRKFRATILQAQAAIMHAIALAPGHGWG